MKRFKKWLSDLFYRDDCYEFNHAKVDAHLALGLTPAEALCYLCTKDMEGMRLQEDLRPEILEQFPYQVIVDDIIYVYYHFSIYKAKLEEVLAAGHCRICVNPDESLWVQFEDFKKYTFPSVKWEKFL